VQSVSITPIRFANAANAVNVFLPLISRSGQASQPPTQQTIRCREGDGLAVNFSKTHVMPTANGVSVSVTISSANTSPGVYLVPIVGVSDNYEAVVDIQVTVTN
jgi:hypothetical protein